MTDDTISRKAAIDAITQLAMPLTQSEFPQEHYVLMGISDSLLAIKDLPSAQSERKGKWIHGREISRDMIGDCVTAIFYEGWKCSECTYLVEEYRRPLWNFCPHCGAEMREDGEQNV